MVDEKTGTTGPRYTEAESLIVQAGATAGLSAEQIATRLPGRGPESVQVHASQILKVSLATYKPVTVAPSGQLGIRFAPNELSKYRDIIERAAKRYNLNTVTKVIKAALLALDKQTP